MKSYPHEIHRLSTKKMRLCTKKCGSKDRELSQEAKEKIKAILMEERKKARKAERAKDPKVKYGM